MNIFSLARSFSWAVIAAFITLSLLPPSNAQAAVAPVTSSVFPAIPTYVDGVTGILQFAAVTGQPVPTGSVTYSVDAGTPATAVIMHGTAYLNLGPFAVGSHTLTTSYSGDSVYQTATQPALQFAVVDQAFALVGVQGTSGFVDGLVFNTQGVATDSNDTLYESDYAENNVRSLGIHDYDPTLLPLTGTVHPWGLATDANNNLYIADNGNGNIYKYTPAGVQTTLPITGLGLPTQLALDRARNLLYIADPNNQRIVRYDLAAGGALTPVVTGLANLVGISLDPAGNLYYSDYNAGYHHLDAAGNDIPLYYNVTNTSAYVGGIFVDRRGYVYVSDTGYNTLLRIDSLGHQTHINDGGNPVGQLADDSQGRLFLALGGRVDIIDPINGRAADFAGDLNMNGSTNPSINYAIFAMPQGVYSLSTSYAPAVNFTAFGGTSPNCPNGSRWGTCNTGFSLAYTLPGLRVGNVIATYSSGPTLSRVLYGNAIGSAPAFSPGTQTASATTAQAVSGVGLDQLGNYYAADATANKVTKTRGGVTTPVAFNGLSDPATIAVDGLAAVYVLDSGHGRIVKLDAANNQTVPVIAGTSNPLTALSAFALDGDAQIYYVGPAGTTSSLYLFDRTGATTLLAANLVACVSLALDPFGDVYLLQADGSLLRIDSHRVQTMLSPAGTFAQPVGLGVDPSGTAYVLQSASPMVTLVHPDSTTATIPVPALLQGVGLALDGRGSILTADRSTNNFIFVDRSHQDFLFGNVPLNQTTTFSAFFANSGDQPFTITAGVPGNNDFKLVTTPDACFSAPATTTIAPAASCNLSYTVRPTVAGTLSASSRITTTAADLGVDFDNFSATAVAAPMPVLTPASLTFSSTVGVASASQPATLTNSGSAALGISSIAITGTNAASFTQTNTCGTSVAAGASCSFAITCTPTAVGALVATLAVNYPSPQPQQTLALSCAATAALVPQAALTAAAANFANVTVGTASMAQTFTLTNAGNAALAISSVALGGANPASFALGANSCGASLAAGAACTIVVSFTPASVGAASAILAVVDSVGTQSSSLTGTGVAPAAPLAALTPATAAFGTVTVGSSSAGVSFTLTNAGNAALAITSVSLGGADAADFAVASNTCGASLAAASSCTITDTFMPLAPGADTATLSVLDSVGTQSSTLTGTGAAAIVADFGITATPATQTVTAGNSASYTVSVDSASGTFTQPVVLTATGLPTGATVTFSAASVTPGAGGSTTTMTIQTAAIAAANRLGAASDAVGAPLGTPMLAVLLMVPFGLRKRSTFRVSWVMAVIVVAGALQGCGGGFALPQSTSTSTPPPTQTYTVTITGTSGSLQHSTVVQISVQG